MPSITDINDFVISHTADYHKNDYVDLTLSPRAKTVPMLVKKNTRNWKSGSPFKFSVKVATQDNARETELYDTDSSNVVNMLDQGEETWAQYTTNFSYDVNEEAFSGGAAEVIDYLDVKNHDMLEGFWELMESRLWSSPSSETQRPRRLKGIPFWIQKNGATAAGALNGGNPSGFPAGRGNISSTTYDQWQNWTFAHDGTVTLDGFIERVVRAQHFTGFVAAHAYPSLGGDGENRRFAQYTTFRMKLAIGKFLRSQNDDLGKDAAAMLNTAILGGNTVEEVPYLTENLSADTSAVAEGHDPFYGIDWSTFFFYRKRGKWMQRTEPIRKANSHTVYTVHMDSFVQLVCTNLRANFVGSYKV